jgi:phospholipid transport system substrate-binding protein
MRLVRIPGGLVWCALVGALSGFLSGAAAPPAATTPASARAVIEKLTREVLVILRDSTLARPQQRRQITNLAYGILDFDTLSRLTLGLNWRSLTAAQQTDFVREYRQHLANTYGHTTDEYTDEDIAIASDRAETNGDWTVLTRIIGTKDGTRQEIAKVEYRLRKKDDAWKIIDVTIDGVSLMANFRAQFQEIMANGGIDRLLKLLRDKNAAADQ